MLDTKFDIFWVTPRVFMHKICQSGGDFVDMNDMNMSPISARKTRYKPSEIGGLFLGVQHEHGFMTQKN